MTKVYIVVRLPVTYDDASINLNVFSSEEKAECWVNKTYPELIHVRDARYRDVAYTIEEHMLDAD